ncbi:MAG: hypothetical protein SGBAC_009817 [Bacillariaceae sp.]
MDHILAWLPIGPQTAWIFLAFLWSLNGPTERTLMMNDDRTTTTISPAVYSRAKALAVGAAYLATAGTTATTTMSSFWQETLAVFYHPAMWVLLGVSLINTPLNAYIITRATPATQLPAAQVLSNLLRAVWWSWLLGKPLTARQYVGIALAAVSCVLLRG